MTVILYELAAENPDVRFSPHCWKVRMALAHKNIVPETIPWRFTDKDEIAHSGQGQVPVLVHDDQVFSNSWQIVSYLEETFTDSPALFNSDGEKHLAHFFNNWADTVLLPSMAQLIITDIYKAIAPQDRAYFRETREKAIGKKLEDFCADRDVNVQGFRKLLTPMRVTLQSQPFLSGEQPSYADYCVFGPFMWARSISDFAMLDPDDSLNEWMNGLLDAFDGMARNAARSN